MGLAWIWIFSLLSSWITPCEAALGSWDPSALLSVWDPAEHSIGSEAMFERRLSREKRAAGISQYIVDIEISFPNTSFGELLKQYIANLTFPIVIASPDTNITSMVVTTACNQTGKEVQCSCETGYTWPTNICTLYSACPGSDPSNCNCITGVGVPSQFCHPNPVSLNLSLTLLEEFTADLKDPTSAKYKKYKLDLDNQLYKAYGSLPGFKSANITIFRPGSVSVEYTVVTEPVSTATMTIANDNLLLILKSLNYTVDPLIRNIVTGWSTITVNLSNIFPGDSVELACKINITSFDSVAWYINGTGKIQNTSNTNIMTTATSSHVQSVLTIMGVTWENAGTYLCTVDLGTDSHEAQKDISIQPMNMTALTSLIPCDNTEVPLINCCTHGDNAPFTINCSDGAKNNALSKSASSCTTYTIRPTPLTCSVGGSSVFDCTCFTSSGASLTQRVPVTYQVPFTASITSGSDIVSEGRELKLQCKCNASTVLNMAWYFTTPAGSNPISSSYYTSNLSSCSSNLTIPSNVMSVSWRGTFNCSVNNVVSASKDIQVVVLARQNQIIRAPVQTGFQCNTTINFSCQVPNITQYNPNAAVLLIYGSGGNVVNRINMNLVAQSFRATYTPTAAACVDFTATCNISNILNDTTQSERMTLTYVEDPQCTKDFVGILNAVATEPCDIKYPGTTGTVFYKCTAMANGATEWVEQSKDCVLASLNQLNDTVSALTSPGSDASIPGIVVELSKTVTSEKQNITSSVANIQLVIDILRQVDTVAVTVEQQVMENFLQTVNVIVDYSSTETWSRVPNRVQESSSLLHSVENFARKLDVNGTVEIVNNENIHLIGTTNLATEYKVDFNFNQTNNLTGKVFINETILKNISAGTRVVSVAYATLKDIIPTSNGSNAIVGGLVMTTVLTSNYSQFQIRMDFKKSNKTLDNATCVFWNFMTQDWDSSGCRAKNMAENVICECDHLTSFSILMSLSDTMTDEEKKALDYITYIGVGISILSLVICIVIEAVVWKSVTKNKTSYMRHVCIMNIAVSLLIADIWFIVGAAVTDKAQACVAATFFTHLFYLCVFFWMLVMGMILFYRLMCVFHDLSKTTMMGISFFVGYGCPVIITVITVAVTQPRNTYTSGYACWLNIIESKAFIAFVVPALTILLLNFITMLVVIGKLLRPSVGDRAKKDERSTLMHIAKCIVILTPLLGLTWGFGIGTMSSQSVAIHGIFAALNSLQGLFILLFGCLMDKKVRDALFSRFSVSKWTSQQTKTSNLSSADPSVPKGGINLFGRKGIYNISSAQAGTSSEMTSSNSYSLLS